MDIISIIVAVVLVIILLAVSFYIFAVYCHPEDKGIGVSIPSKLIIVICQGLAWGQLLILPLDVSNLDSSSSSTLQIVYSVVYLIILVVSVFVVPFTMFLYEADEQDTLFSRICWSLLFAGIITAIFMAVIFISYIWLSLYSLTVNGITTTYRLPAPLYAMIAFSLGGWVILILNGGIGMVYLPYDLIMEFVRRPKQLSTEQAFEKKTKLQQKSNQLIESGQSLKAKSEQFIKNVNDMGWFTKRKQQSSLKNSLQYYKRQVNTLQQEYEIFDEEIKVTKTHPLVYYLKLIAGILCIIVSLFWFIQLVGTTIQINKKASFSFIDSLLANLSNTGVSFLATFIYAFLVFYLQICAIKGNLVFGIRIPYLISFHAMKPNKTYLNSFLFNVNLMMLSSVATTQLSLIAFQLYLQKTYLERLFETAVSQLPLFGFLYVNRVFNGCLTVMILLSFISVIVRIIIGYCKSKKEIKTEQKQK